MLFDQRAPLCKRFAHHFLSLQDQQVKDEEMEGSAGRAVILEGIEGRPALGVKGHHLAVENGFIWHGTQGRYYAWVSGVEVVIITGTRVNFAGGFDGEGFVPIE